MFLLKRKIKLIPFVLLLSTINFLFFHYPFFKFVANSMQVKSLSGITLLISLVILMLVVNAFVFFLIFYLSIYVGKFLAVVFFIINSIAIYFISTYNNIIDESMISNILNTNYAEASSFFSIKIIIYLAILGIAPSIFIIKADIIKPTFKKFAAIISLSILAILIIVIANNKQLLWVDKNSKTLGGLAMPWCYSVNIALHYLHKYKANQKEIILPNAAIKDDEKSVLILVIGESARSQNFQLYGYPKNTNPLLAKATNVYHYKANSCATYTTAGLKCMLQHKNTNDLYEILPNYLYRNGVDVVWRSNNWGQPPIHIKNFQTKDTLQKYCKGDGCNYDEILLTNLQQQIETSTHNKILIILHANTSHGPTYSKKYPPQFEVFKPVCNTVELANCTNTELTNAYDNTIVYTDYLLNSIINTLQKIPNYKSAMLFVSDHGESLGEKNLYMHGMPISIAPKEQYEIPFIVWVSQNSKAQLKPLPEISQQYVFHSVLNFLHISSPIYDSSLSIFTTMP